MKSTGETRRGSHRLVTRAFYRVAGWLTGQTCRTHRTSSCWTGGWWTSGGDSANARRFFAVSSRGLASDARAFSFRFRAGRQAIRAGRSGSLATLAIHAVTSFSALPLQIVTVLGLITLVVAAAIAVQAVRLWYNGSALPGFTTVILLQLMIGGFLMVSLGIIGTYIARIYEEVKGRPRKSCRRSCAVTDTGPSAAPQMPGRRREGDAIAMAGDYQAQALQSPRAAQRFWHAARVRLIDRLAAPDPRARMPMPGCGSGVIAAHLASSGARGHGFDSNPSAIAFASRTYVSPKLRFVLGPFEQNLDERHSISSIAGGAEHLYEEQASKRCAFSHAPRPGARSVRDDAEREKRVAAYRMDARPDKPCRPCARRST